MRHSYVADVGDFGKYGLIRALCAERPTCHLGVVWYLTEVIETRNDGRHDGYLSGAANGIGHYRNCDPDLYDRLGAIRKERCLNIGVVESGDVLPAETLYYGDAVPSRGNAPSGTDNRMRRHEWFRQAFEALRGSDLVLADPDNGVRFEDREMARNKTEPRKSPKHAYWEELETFLRDGTSLVVYHHLGRKAGGHIAEIQRCLAAVLERGYRSFGIHFRRGSARLFLVIPARDTHHEWLKRGCARFADRWRAHCALANFRPWGAD